MFENKTVIVAGVEDMSCAELAIEVARQGAKVLLIDREKDKLVAVQKRIQEIGGQAHVYECDVDNSSAIAQLAQKIKNSFGCCDCLINGSGRDLGKLFSVNTIIKMRAENSYVAAWVETRTDICPSVSQRAPRLHLCM